MKPKNHCIRFKRAFMYKILTVSSVISHFPVLVFLVFTVISHSAFSDVKLMVLRPTQKHLGFIIPVREGRNLHDEINLYKKNIQTNLDLRKVISDQQLDQLSLGQVYQLPKTESPKVLALANRGYDYESKPTGAGRNRIEKFREKLDANIAMYILPVAIANYLNATETLEFYSALSSHFSGVIALGGADVAPEIYDEPLKESRDVNLSRDRYEINFLSYWIQNKKGFLYGVCRGHQLISAALGFKLIQHISDHGDGIWEKHHILTKPTQSKVFDRIFATKANNFLVNSYHHQAVIYQNQVNPEIEVAATDLHGTVESLSSRDGRIFTTQFHPEFMNGYVSKRLFTYLSAKLMMSNPVYSCKQLF